MLKRLTSFNFPVWDFLKQTLMTLNIFIIYLAVVLYKKSRGLSIHRHNLVKITLLFLQVLLLSISGGHGTNAGRYFYIIVPVVIFFLVKEVASAIKN
jgi:hypothetical protein